MSKEKDVAWKDMYKRSDESRDETFKSWIVDSEDSDDDQKEQEDCENCES